MSYPNRLAVAIAALTLFATIPSADAATAAGAGIELDGKYVGGYTITRDGESREHLVRQLSKQYITFERDFKVPVDAKDPALATLEGEIRLLSKIRGDRQAMATTKVLQLVKRGGKWYAEPESLKRALNDIVLNDEGTEKEKPDPRAAKAEGPKPVTLEITSGKARPVKVENAIVCQPDGRNLEAGVKSLDGIPFLQGEAEVTIAWSRIKSVTIGERPQKDGTHDAVVELTSGEKQNMQLRDTNAYIAGETGLGKFKLNLTKITAIKNIAAPDLFKGWRAAGSLPDSVIVRVLAELGRTADLNEKVRADAEARGLKFDKTFTELWEFTTDHIHRTVREFDGREFVYRRVGSRPLDSKGVCQALVDGEALEIRAGTGEGEPTLFAGTDYTLGVRSLEVLQDGERVYYFGENCAFAGYPESKAKAFAAFYESLASKARGAFEPKPD